MSTSHTSRAVVLGGSLAGLLAARVLADHYAEVLVVDRDDVAAAGAEPRRGVPQGQHPHAVLLGGALAIERLLAGWTDALAARGALCGDIAGDAEWYCSGGPLRRPRRGLTAIVASRPLIEDEVRRRVVALPRVTLRGGVDVAGLVASEDGRRVIGARLVDRAPGSAATAVPADLVVDATGRGSRTPAWLAELGHAGPPEERVDLDLTYVTRTFRGGPDLLGGPVVSVVGARPADSHSGVALAREGGQWIVALIGHRGTAAPTDLEGFRAYADALPSRRIGRLVRTAEPLGDARVFRFPASRWRHYERRGLPAGLVVLGDAVCSFDPAFGQGMSSAAQQAEVLQRVLADGADGAALGRRVAAGAARVISVPWTLTVGVARRFPDLPPKPLPARVLDRYLDRLLRVATVDDEGTLAYLKVVNLVAEPPSLLAPRIAWRVLSRPAPASGGPGMPGDLPPAAVADLPSAHGRLAR